MEDLGVVSSQYFRSLNSIAKRICDDINSTRDNYETAWHYLSVDERNQVINESLIYPDAVLRYSLVDNQDSKVPLDNKLSQGCRILQDETGAEWRDEHSGPFSWKTSSQLLDTFRQSEPEPKIKKKPPVPPPKPPKPVKPAEMVPVSEDSSSQQENSTLSEDEHSSFNSQVI